MNNLLARWSKAEDWFLDLTQREKLIIAFAAVFLVGLALFKSAIEPNQAKLQMAERQNTSLSLELSSLNTQIREIENALKLDPNEKIKAEIEQIRADIAKIDIALQEAMTEYIAPEKMALALTNLLASSGETKVIGMEVLAPEQVEVEGDDSTPVYFRHKFEIRAQGDYFNLMAFVDKVSGENSQFVVQQLEYQVVKYPEAQMKLTLETISDNQNVIRL